MAQAADMPGADPQAFGNLLVWLPLDVILAQNAALSDAPSVLQQLLKAGLHGFQCLLHALILGLQAVQSLNGGGGAVV